MRVIRATGRPGAIRRYSIPIRLDMKERERAEDVGQVGRGRRVQAGFVEAGERRGAEQAPWSDHFVFEQLKHPYDAGFTGGRERPALQATYADDIGPGRD